MVSLTLRSNGSSRRHALDLDEIRSRRRRETRQSLLCRSQASSAPESRFSLSLSLSLSIVIS